MLQVFSLLSVHRLNLYPAFEIQKACKVVVNKGISSIIAPTSVGETQFLNFKPQGVADFTVFAAFCVIRRSYYCRITHALQLQQTCQLPNIG